MTDRTIRRFRPSDEVRVCELHERAMRETPEYVPDAPDDDLRSITDTYLDADGEFLVAEREGRVVAMGAYRPIEAYTAEVVENLGQSTMELTRMRVAPDHQRRGHGRAVYHELERRARAEGYTEFVLDTGAENHAAREFYESLSFEFEQHATLEFGDTAIDLAFYRKPIDV